MYIMYESLYVSNCVEKKNKRRYYAFLKGVITRKRRNNAKWKGLSCTKRCNNAKWKGVITRVMHKSAK